MTNKKYLFKVREDYNEYDNRNKRRDPTNTRSAPCLKLTYHFLEYQFPNHLSKCIGKREKIHSSPTPKALSLLPNLYRYKILGKIFQLTMISQFAIFPPASTLESVWRTNIYPTAVEYVSGTPHSDLNIL